MNDRYNPPVIQLSGVQLKLSGRQLLQDFDWQLPDPGAYLLLGPTGSGKSLLARVLTGRLRPQRGAVLIDGLSPYALIGGYGEPLFLAQAEVACREAEPLDLYLEAELARAGESPAALEPIWPVLDEHIADRRTVLSDLAHGQVLLAQIALAAVMPVRLAVLDGHLTYLDRIYCTAAAELIEGVNREQEKFLLAATARLAGYFPPVKGRFLLSGDWPLSISRLEDREFAGLPSGAEPLGDLLRLHTLISPVLHHGITSGRNFTIVEVLEDGLRVKITGRLDDALAELRVQGMSPYRIDWEAGG